MATTVNKAPVSVEELSIIMLIDSFGKTKWRSLNQFIKKALLNAVNSGTVQMDNGKPVLTEKAQPILDCIDDGQTQHDFIKLATDMRELFPVGVKPDDSGGSGTHLWRCSVSTAVDRFKMLTREVNEPFTDEEALEATKAYVKHCTGDKYMRTMPYFIIKKMVKDGDTVWHSDLIDWIYRVRDGITEEEPKTTTLISDLL